MTITPIEQILLTHSRFLSLRKYGDAECIRRTAEHHGIPESHVLEALERAEELA